MEDTRTAVRRDIERHLRDNGLDGIPWGLEIAFPPADPPVVEIRHLAHPRDKDKTIGRVDMLDAEAIRATALDHARRVLRSAARARAAMMRSQGPMPLHMLEAHPLLMAFRRLAADGRAALDGDIRTVKGCYHEARDLAVRIDGRALEFCQSEGRSVLEIAGDIPDTVLTAIAGRRLLDVVALPSSGDDRLDMAVAGITIAEARRGRDRPNQVVVLHLDPTPVVEVEPTPPGEDGSWKTMEPIPLA